MADEWLLVVSGTIVAVYPRPDGKRGWALDVWEMAVTQVKISPIEYTPEVGQHFALWMRLWLPDACECAFDGGVRIPLVGVRVSRSFAGIALDGRRWPSLTIVNEAQ